MSELALALQIRRAMASDSTEHWATQITKSIYLGSGSNAQNLAMLKKHNITHILNVAHPNYFQGNNDSDSKNSESNFIYCNLNVADFGGEVGGIGKHFGKAIEFVKENKIDTSVIQSGSDATNAVSNQIQQSNLNCDIQGHCQPSSESESAQNNVNDNVEKSESVCHATDSASQDLIPKPPDIAMGPTQSEIQINPNSSTTNGYSNSKLLIHCANGSNRSCTTTIAILMEIHNWSLKESYTYVKQKRKSCIPLRDNRQELMKFDVKKYGKNSMTEGGFR